MIGVTLRTFWRFLGIALAAFFIVAAVAAAVWYEVGEDAEQAQLHHLGEQ